MFATTGTLMLLPIEKQNFGNSWGIHLELNVHFGLNTRNNGMSFCHFISIAQRLTAAYPSF